MSATGLDTFDKALHVTHAWLGDVMEDLGPDRQAAWHALGVVLRCLRDRLPLELSAHLGAQLPLMIRGTYYEQWRPEVLPEKYRGLDEFLAHVSEGLSGAKPLDPSDAAQAVFRAVSRHVDRGQIEKVREALPGEIRTLWPEAMLAEAPSRGS